MDKGCREVQRVITMQFKAHDLISRAVDEGVERGMARAYKHIDRPARDEIITVIQDEVMASLGEIIEWEDNPCPS